MKKSILIAMFLLSTALWAQHWVYHNVGDTVFDLQGHTLLDRPAVGSETTLPVADWPAGTYLFIIHTDQGSETRKLVKQ